MQPDKSFETNMAVLEKHVLALEMTRQKNIQAAISLYQEMLEMNPISDYEKGAAFCNLGQLLSETGRRQSGIQMQYKAIKVYPGHADAYRSLKLDLIALGRHVERLYVSLIVIKNFVAIVAEQVRLQRLGLFEEPKSVA
jgi:tetratricopeptide (TPR) repeat protein